MNAASTASPSSSAAMLDCEKQVISPASSHASTAAPSFASRRAAPQHDGHHGSITSIRKRP